MSLGIALSRMSSIMDPRINFRGVRVIIGPIIGFALIKFLN